MPRVLRCGAAGLVGAALLWGCVGNPFGGGEAPASGEVALVVGCDSAAVSAAAATGFCLSAAAGAAPLVLRSGALAAGDEGAAVTWDFGDGSGAAGAAAEHVYVRPGVYEVSVRVTDGQGSRRSGAVRVTVAPPASRIAGPELCRTGESIRLSVAAPPPYPCTWSARDGQLTGSGAEAVYTAPASPGRDSVRAVFDVAGVPFAVAAEVLVYRQFIILKADDLGLRTARWERYLDYLDERGLAGTVGVIWKRMKQAEPEWRQKLLALQATGRCEFFHHGWDHASGDNLDGTAPGVAMWEFSGTSHEYQRRHLQEGLDAARELGFRVTTFGPPFNKADATTVRALDETPAILSVLFAPPGGGRLHFRRVVDIENGPGRPDLAHFVVQYRAHQAEDYLVLQVHPGAIEESRFAELERILSLLVAEGRTFVTAEEYRRLDLTRR